MRGPRIVRANGSVRWRTDDARGVVQAAMAMNPAALRFLLLMLLLAVLIAIAGWPAHGVAQAAGASGTSRALAERAAVDLRQGMTPEEVRELLGRPWRTALSGNGGSGGGTLRWTYAWTGSPSSSSSERILNVDFNAATAEQWSVSGWSWSSF